jgi:hypothetical protein
MLLIILISKKIQFTFFILIISLKCDVTSVICLKLTLIPITDFQESVSVA